MDRLSTMQLFLRVSATGSFSKAAREFGVSQPTASKQIAALEQRLGAQLLRRTSRGLSLTTAGSEYQETAERLLGELDAAESRIGDDRKAPAGRVRVAMSSGFGRLYVIPRLPELTRQFPDVTFDIEISDRHVNMVEAGIDVAIRFGNLSDSALVARRIGSKALITVATPGYLEEHGEPGDPSELASHLGILLSSRGAAVPWRYQAPDGPMSILPKEAFRSNDAELIRAAALAGGGLAQAAHWLFARDIASGTLRRLFHEFDPPLLPISAIWPSGRLLPARVQVFVDFLAQLCAEDETLNIVQGGQLDFRAKSEAPAAAVTKTNRPRLAHSRAA